MHEHHIIDDLLKDLLERARREGANRITRITLRLGGLTELDGETIRHVFGDHAKGTACEGAEVVIEKSERRELTLVSFDVE